jgi:hypothetical protein
VGSTGFPGDVNETRATLYASGYSDDGPMSWWWEYDNVRAELGTDSDTEVCGNPPQPDRRCGPASFGSPDDHVRMGTTVTGLIPGTTYHYRVCGQDVNDARATCAQVLSFTTLPDESDFGVATVARREPNGATVTLPIRFRCPAGKVAGSFLFDLHQQRSFGGDFPPTTCTGSAQTATATFNRASGEPFVLGDGIFTGCFYWQPSETGFDSRRLGPYDVQIRDELPAVNTFVDVQGQIADCPE